MTPSQPGSPGTAGRLTVVFIGADAASVPAESLRALAEVDSVFAPAGLSPGLRDLLLGRPPARLMVGQEAAAGVAFGAASGAHLPGAGLRRERRLLLELDPADPTPALEAACSSGAAVAAAGPDGPRLVRRLREAVAGCADLHLDTVPPQPLFDDCVTAQVLVSLLRVTRVLRERCPWDRVQTAGDIISYSLEEVYELADAIAAGDLYGEHSELGDVLFQVYFLALLLEEQGVGDLSSVAEGIERKLIRRHTHIFGGATADTPAAVRGQWERVKREQEGRRGIFHDVPVSLPALIYARKLQRRAAEVGFDWSTAHEAFPKIAEEHAELRAALEAHGPLSGFDDPVAAAEPAGPETSDAIPDGVRERPSPAAEMRHDPQLRHEVGDLLFAVVNVARKAGVDPELALREAAQRFQRRVLAAAELAAAEGRDWGALGLGEQERYYQRAKRCLG